MKNVIFSSLFINKWFSLGIAGILCLYLFLLTVPTSEQYFYKVFVIKWKYLTILTPILLLISGFLFYKNKKLQICNIDILVLFFVLLISFSYIRSNYLAHTKFNLFILLSGTYFWGKILFFCYKKDITQIFIGCIIGMGFIQSIIGLLQLFNILISNNQYFKLTGSFVNPAPYAIFLALSYVLSISILVRRSYLLKLKSRLYYYLLVFNICLGTLLLPVTQSRTAWISVLGTIFMVLFIELKWKDKIYIIYKTKLSTFIIGGLIILFSCGLCLLGIYFLKKDSADARSVIWKVSLQLIQDNPIYGVGYGKFEGVYGQKQSEYLSSVSSLVEKNSITDVVQYACNDYLQLVMENGILVLIILLGILFLSIKRLKRIRSVLLYPLLVILIASLTSYPLQTLPILIVLVLILSFSASFGHITSNKIITSLSFSFVVLVYFIISLCQLIPSLKKYDAYRVWQDTQRLYPNHNYAVICKYYDSIYQYLNDQGLFLFEYGKVLSQIAEYEKSNRILREGLILSGDPMFYNVLGNNYKKMNLIPLAEKAYLQAYNTLPNRIYPLYLLAKLYYDTKNYKQFILYAQKVLSFSPKIFSPAINNMKKEIGLLYENI